jgi:hypothetical protein
MAATRTQAVVLDMDSIQLIRARGRDVVYARSSAGEVLSLVRDVSELSTPETVFRAFDAALAGKGVLRPGHSDSCIAIALYDSGTGQISLGPLPATTVWQAAKGLTLPGDGTIVEVTTEEMTGRGFRAVPHQVDYRQLVA